MDDLLLARERSCPLRFTQSQFNAFARLSRDDNPIHTDPDFSARTTFGRTVAHGMFLYGHVVRELGRLAPSCIQLYQEMMFPNPTFVGEDLQLELSVIDTIEDKRIAKVETTITKPNGKIGFQGHSLVHPPTVDTSSSFPEVELEHPSPLSSETTHKGLILGQKDEIASSISQSDIVEYQTIFNDENRLFTDSEFARQLGFENCLVPYSMIGGLFSYQLGMRLPGRGTNWLKQRFRFLRPLYLDQEAITKVQIVRIRSEKDLMNLSTIGQDQRGNVFVEGEALVHVQDIESSSL